MMKYSPWWAAYCLMTMTMTMTMIMTTTTTMVTAIPDMLQLVVAHEFAALPTQALHMRSHGMACRSSCTYTSCLPFGNKHALLAAITHTPALMKITF